jgi:3-deoxy-D-manno-octulosonic-acid transferase
MILESARRGTSVAVVSGKISHNSYQRYRLARPMMRHLLSEVTCVAAQTEADMSRFCALGLDPRRARVTGDIKLDAELPQKPPTAPDWLPEVLEGGHRWLLCAGSTRPGEEEAVARGALIAADSLGEGLTVIIAPRHIQRAEAVDASLRSLGFDVVRRTTLPSNGWKGQGPRALVLDTIGELGGVYPQCDVAFVGGTLSPHGGHNLAEPAAVGVPVLFGPHVEKTSTTAESLVASGGGLMVSGAEELGAHLARLLSDSSERARRGAAARDAIESLQGATERTVQFLRESGALPC